MRHSANYVQKKKSFKKRKADQELEIEKIKKQRLDEEQAIAKLTAEG